ncbi:MAG: NAD(P)-dependent oxidoreductase [Spirochaetota bacterium]
MNIAFIGLGLMGSRMAANIQRHVQKDLVVYNRSREKAEPLIAEGAEFRRTPEEAAADADVLITMLSSPDVVAQVSSGEHGFLGTLKEGALWIDCSTVNPSFSRTMHAFARSRGIRFVDAPVAGTTGPAESGELLVLAGGEESDISEAHSIFQAIGRKTIHVGEVGKGASMKMVVNFLLGHALAGFSEAAHLGKRLGLDQKQLFDTLLGGPITAPFLGGKRENFENGEYPAEFPLELAHKDLHLAAQTAYEAGAFLPSGAAVKELFSMATQAGLGKEDVSAVYKMFRGIGDVDEDGDSASDAGRHEGEGEE